MCGDNNNQVTSIPTTVKFNSSEEQRNFAERVARNQVDIFNYAVWKHYDKYGNRIFFTNA